MFIFNMDLVITKKIPMPNDFISSILSFPFNSVTHFVTKQKPHISNTNNKMEWRSIKHVL